MASNLRRSFRNLLQLKYGFLRASIVPVKDNISCQLFLVRFYGRNDSPSYSLLSEKYHHGNRFTLGGRIPGLLLSGVLGFLGLEKEKEKEDELVLTIKRSILLIQRGELHKAELMLHLALKIAQERQDPDGITYVYDLLANLALEKGEHAKAEKLFVSVMQRLMTSGAKQDDNRIIHASLKLAQMHAENVKEGDPERAEAGFRFCIEALEKKVQKGGEGEADEDSILLLALTKEAYARFCLSQSRLKESQKYLEEAAELLERGISLGQRGSDEEFRTALLLNDLGSVCSLNGDQTSAKQHLLKAIQCGERGLQMRKGAEDPHKPMGDEELVASFKINLGVVSARMGLLEEAQKHCHEGWKVAKQMNNEELLREGNSCLDEVKKLFNK